MGNRQSERSKRWMEEALFQLMREKRFQEITVTDITVRAGISRLTFYRNFETRESVLYHHFGRLFEEYLTELKERAPCSLETALVLCFDKWKAHRPESDLLLRHDLGNILCKPFGDYLDQALRFITLPVKLSETQRRFVIGGMYFTMLDWLADDRGRSSRMVADEIIEFIRINPSGDTGLFVG